jgi:hypothetical protein
LKNKFNKKKIKTKKYRFEKNDDQIWKKNDDGWNWKIILINKKIRKKIHIDNNKKNEAKLNKKI